jgi:phage tail protein X
MALSASVEPKGFSVPKLRARLRKEVGARLVGRGRHAAFAPVHKNGSLGRRVPGLTKRLAARFFSGGAFPSAAARGRSTFERAAGQPKLPKLPKLSGRCKAPRALGPRGSKRWRGPKAGFRRGADVDRQLSQLANGRKLRKGTKAFHLTRVVLAALARAGLEPVMGQFGVSSVAGALGTAADLLCLDASKRTLWVVELKTGYRQGRAQAAMQSGRPQQMRGLLSDAPDCLCNRHMAQLAATTAMFRSTPGLAELLPELGVESVQGLLLYATDEDVEYVEMQSWWTERGGAIVDACC